MSIKYQFQVLTSVFRHVSGLDSCSGAGEEKCFPKFKNSFLQFLRLEQTSKWFNKKSQKRRKCDEIVHVWTNAKILSSCLKSPLWNGSPPPPPMSPFSPNTTKSKFNRTKKTLFSFSLLLHVSRILSMVHCKGLTLIKSPCHSEVNPSPNVSLVVLKLDAKKDHVLFSFCPVNTIVLQFAFTGM